MMTRHRPCRTRVDLINLDPPFKSNRAYNAIYKDETGEPLPDHIRVYGNSLDASGALMAGLIVPHPLSKRSQWNYQQAVARAGGVEIDGALYPRMQMLTVQEIFDDNCFDTPGARAKRESWQKQMDLSEQN